MMTVDEMKSGLHELETDQLVTLSAALTIVQSGAIDEVLPEVHSIIQTRQGAADQIRNSRILREVT